MSKFKAMHDLLDKVKEQEEIIRKLSQDYVIDAIRDAAHDLRESIPRLVAIQWHPVYDVLDLTIKVRTFSGVKAVSVFDLHESDILPIKQVDRVQEFADLLNKLFDQLGYAFGAHQVSINLENMIMKVEPQLES